MTNATAIFRLATVGALIAAAPVCAFAGETTGSSGENISYDAKTGKYCVKDLLTGSRVAKSICRTREQWAAEGLIIQHRNEAQMAKK